MAIETMQEMEGHMAGQQADISKERPTVIHSPYPDVEVPEVSLPEFVLEQAEERGDAPAVIDALTGRTLSYRDLATQVRHVAAVRDHLLRCGYRGRCHHDHESRHHWPRHADPVGERKCPLSGDHPGTLRGEGTAGRCGGRHSGEPCLWGGQRSNLVRLSVGDRAGRLPS